MSRKNEYGKFNKIGKRFWSQLRRPRARMGIQTSHGFMTSTKARRNAQIVNLALKPDRPTYKEIGEAFHIGRARVVQIIRRGR